jgi:hypothetical protein
MKKLLVLLLISALAIFVFAGCDGIIDDGAEGEGEGEGEGEIEEVTVEIDGAVEVGGKTYVSAGNHDIVVTFPAPVSGTVAALITGCTGDYSKADTDVVLFPNEDKTVWEGSGKFEGEESDDVCCASYVGVYAGECAADVCIEFPVIVDAEPPYAEIVIAADDEDCVCEDCDITFDITVDPKDCAADDECCGDYCSGLANWSIAMFDENPFDDCCETTCAEPEYTCSGTDCPVECSTGCIEVEDGGDEYYVIATLVDEVGNDVEYYAIIDIDSDCDIEVEEFFANECVGGNFLCTDFENDQAPYDSDEEGYVIGTCESEAYGSIYNYYMDTCEN